MTIKELEARTGMVRANIRYYEEEGLLAPRRLDNGYRDYSEEDVRTLEKIKLLRSLQLDIDTIRQLQRGKLTLEQAMANQLTRLEGDRAGLERAAQICRRIQSSGVEYAALEPEPLLRELAAPGRPATSSAPPPGGRLTLLEEIRARERRAAGHPWMRWLARWLDLSLWSLPVDAVGFLVLRLNVLDLNPFGDWLLALAAVVVMAVAEPLLLHFWGWTPGKWIFGLKLRDAQGNKLSLRAAWRRVWGVFLRGDGLNIPLYNLWRNYRCYRCCKDGEDCPWDYGKDVEYTREERRWVALTYVGATAAVMFLTLVITLQWFLPPNRGGLTAEEFSENCNYYLDLLAPGGLWQLGEDGQWEYRENLEAGAVLVFQEPYTRFPLELELTGDRVTAVTLRDVYREDEVQLDQTYAAAVTLALAGARREWNCFTFGYPGWTAFWEDRFQSFQEDYRGLSFRQQVELEGYGPEYGGWYEALGTGEQKMERTVTISLK